MRVFPSNKQTNRVTCSNRSHKGDNTKTKNNAHPESPQIKYTQSSKVYKIAQLACCKLNIVHFTNAREHVYNNVRTTYMIITDNKLHFPLQTTSISTHSA